MSHFLSLLKKNKTKEPSDIIKDFFYLFRAKYILF
jgi:hypothetical protein